MGFQDIYAPNKLKNEVFHVPLRELTIIRFFDEFEKLSAGLCRYITEEFIDRGEGLNNLKRCFFETDGFGVLKVINFETARIIHLPCKIVSIDDETENSVYLDQSKIPKLIIHTFKVVFEITSRGSHMSTCPFIEPHEGLMLTVLKAENMNRLVKNAIRDYGRPFEPGFIFNRKTGQFAEYPSYGYSKLSNWYRVTNEHFPIYNGPDFVAYCWRDEIILNINNTIVPEDMTEFIKSNRLIRPRNHI